MSMAFSLFGKRDKSELQPDSPSAPEPQEQKRGFFDRMKQAVTRTRESFSESISSVIALTREVDETTLVGLEPILLAARGHHDGRRQRHRQDPHPRQARRALHRAGPNRAPLRR